MGVLSYTDEYASPISPPRLFKALVLDAQNLIPKLMPQVVKNIKIIQGDGGARTIRQINFIEGTQLKSVKNRIDELNEEGYSYKYSLIEGDALGNNREFIAYDVQFEPTADGGNKNKMTSKYHTKGDIVLKEEEIKDGKEKALAMYKIVEAYLLQNPNTYA